MKKVKRSIIKIDEDKCTGCGLCISGCPEQALQIVETKAGPKARLVKEFYCDGLGACLGFCPEGAIKVIEQEAEPYNEAATIDRIKAQAPEMLETHIKHMQEHSMVKSKKCAFSCPSVQEMQWKKQEISMQSHNDLRLNSELKQWPIQIHLVNPNAPYFKNADLAVIADCVPFAYANFHQDFLKNNAVIIGCPKLDDAKAYVEKIADIIAESNPKSIKIVHMEVPCCFGLINIVQQAMELAKRKIPVEDITITIKGEKK